MKLTKNSEEVKTELNLTDSNFDEEVLKSDVPVLVDFWATWCGPCKQLSPIIEELSSEYKSSKIKIFKIDVDNNQEISGKYKIMSIPTLLIFKDGKVVDKLIGGIQKEKIKKLIDKNIK